MDNVTHTNTKQGVSLFGVTVGLCWESLRDGTYYVQIYNHKHIDCIVNVIFPLSPCMIKYLSLRKNQIYTY